MGKQKNTLYLECNSGISGDMAVAALLDLGADKGVLKKALQSIPVRGFRIKISRVKKAGLDVCDFHVILDEAHENHDHDMAYLFGEGTAEDKVHVHSEGHAHDHHYGCDHDHLEAHDETHHHGCNHEHPAEHSEVHSHGHDHDGCGHHHHHHEHRGLPEILHIIEHTDMTKEAKETAVRIFKILAKAEAKAHGLPENEVHFHEVGAVDSIVDVISAAVCLDNLGITECIVPELCEGTGTIRCQHGIMSVPVPAVLNIVQEHGMRMSVTDIKGELVTPTGAAIAAAVKTADALPKSFRIIKIGMGGGKRAYERPSILRAMLIEDLSIQGDRGESGLPENKRCGECRDGINSRKGLTDTVNIKDGSVINEDIGGDVDDRDVIYKLETNIDDCSGEMLGYVMDKLLEAGARDVHYMPVYMKKNRPAYQLNVICKKEQITELERIIFAETTTIGIRRQKMERTVLSRRSVEIVTDLGAAMVKECRLPDGRGVRYYPEYESVVKLCGINGKSYQEVYHLILEQCGKQGNAKRSGKRSLRERHFLGRKQQEN